MKNYNTSITENAYKIFALKSGDNPLSDINPLITPTIEIKPSCNIVKQADATAATVTIYTTPSDKDFYLTGFSISSDGIAVNQINMTIQGLINYIRVQGGVSQSHAITNLYYPIKIDRNTNIQAVGAAGSTISVTIWGFTYETTRGV